jgi:hypothetical protein
MLIIPFRKINAREIVRLPLLVYSHWSGVINYREGKIRVISVRRSRKEEVDIYES